MHDPHQPSTSTATDHFDEQQFGLTYVRNVAELLGINELAESVASEVSAHVTFMLRTLLKTADSFRIASRRRHLCQEDVEAALQLFGLPVTSCWQ